MNIENYLFKIPPHKIKLGLERTEKLLEACNNPENQIISIQIIGTNGKGSTSSMVANVLQKQFKVGLFTSPHLIDYKERIKINFKNIKNKDVLLFLTTYKDKIEKIKPSFFEIMTVLSLWYFAKENVDIAILETGLGGRLDSVTACKNFIAAFTNIDLDHQLILGNTIDLIAKEKAGAINQHTKQIFSVKQNPVAEKIIKDKAAQFHLKPSFVINKFEENQFKYLHGKHQQVNASLAESIINY